MADAEAVSAEAADHHRAGRLAEAEQLYRQALALDPMQKRALHNLALLLMSRDRFAEAEPLIAARAEEPEFQALAARLRPAWSAARLDQGTALFRRGDLAAAEAEYRAALALSPAEPVAFLNLGLLLIRAGRKPEALALAEEAETAGAAFAAARVGGEALLRTGRYEEGLAALDRAAALQPGNANVRYVRSFARLLLCDFAGGWADYEARWAESAFRAESAGVVPPALIPRLDRTSRAADLAGRRVLVLGEQGIGDQVMFASCLPDLARTAAEVTFVCESRMAGLFTAAFPQIEVRQPSDGPVDAARFETVLALGSLGRLFRNRIEDFPGTPYLAVSPEVRARWVERLGPKAGALRIGLAWSGGGARSGAARRSLDLAELAAALALPGVELVSLQHGEAAKAAEAFGVRSFPPDATHDVQDLAALIAELDLVVSVQTAVVHLAGGLGTPCLAMIPAWPEWRYTARAPRMPWYGSVELFRQAAPGDWAPVIARVAEAVKSRLPGG